MYPTRLRQVLLVLFGKAISLAPSFNVLACFLHATSKRIYIIPAINKQAKGDLKNWVAGPQYPVAFCV